MNPRFYFATCQTGAEKAVKAEVLAEHPALRFAFSRPGFVTFKEDPALSSAEPVPAFAPLTLHSPVFTRLWGEVVDQTRDPATLPLLLARIPADAPLHAFDRDRFIPGDEPEGYAMDEKICGIAEIGEFIAARDDADSGKSAAFDGAAAGNAGKSGTRTGEASLAVGETVYDLIWVDDYHVFLGRHIHGAPLVPYAGNLPRLDIPENAPSRAWLKLEEALLRFKPVVQSGWQALEIGCAPGGATTALLARGFRVVGVDPQYMADSVSVNQNFRHVRKPARYATKEDLAGVNPDWIVMDMSIPPKDALGELSHVIGLLREIHGKSLAIRRGFLTLKINDWKYASEIGLYMKRLGQIGFENMHAIQLANNRQEFFVYSGKFRI